MSRAAAAMRRDVREAGGRYSAGDGGWVLPADHPHAYDALGRVVPYPLEDAYDEVLRAASRLAAVSP